jgi:hypothetical protein
LRSEKLKEGETPIVPARLARSISRLKVSER